MHSVDVTTANFASEVVQASRNTPILVDFWAPWCGPCKTLMPVLSKLADEFQGAFKLAKVNIDQQQQLAQQFGVRSVPTVKVVKDGQIVDEFTGAIPEPQIRALLAKHIQRESDTLMQHAYANYQAGDKGAKQTMIEIANAEPGNLKLRLLLVDVLIKEKQYDDAKAILLALPAAAQQQPEVAGLLSRLELIDAAKNLPDMASLLTRVESNPNDHQARQQLSTLYITQANYEAAMEQLLEIMRRDRKFDDDAGRKGLLKVFDMLGSGELVTRYRQQMARLLY
jgi:putative thioredoxin